MKICQGDMQKANLGTSRREGVFAAYQQGEALGQVFIGCMAQRGYVQR